MTMRRCPSCRSLDWSDTIPRLIFSANCLSWETSRMTTSSHCVFSSIDWRNSASSVFVSEGSTAMTVARYFSEYTTRILIFPPVPDNSLRSAAHLSKKKQLLYLQLIYSNRLREVILRLKQRFKIHDEFSSGSSSLGYCFLIDATKKRQGKKSCKFLGECGSSTKGSAPMLTEYILGGLRRPSFPARSS